MRIPRYSISPENPNCLSYDGRIEGRIERDIEDFVILLQPGPFERVQPPNPAELPLRGYQGPRP